MDEICEVNTAPFATGPDDPRHKPCGAPAHYKVGDTWMCARHYDECDAPRADTEPNFLDELLRGGLPDPKVRS
jgi:hypothetical protein